jgi:hypothetical protein
MFIRMKNLIVDFVDWYLETNEGKAANFCANFFKSDRDVFIAALSEYAVEFAMAYEYNPFKVETEDVASFSARLKDDLYNKKGTSFDMFSESKNNHMPRALLGNKNYLTFLAGLSAEKQSRTTLKTPVVRSQTANVYHYEQDELKKNFYFRLIMQDRYYEFLYYPISVLKRLFYKHDRKAFFDNWIYKQIDNIIVYTGNSDQILFKDVKTLDIKEDGSVIINGKLKLYTPIMGTNTKEEVNTNTLQNIVIDHVVPFSNVLFELKDELPALRTIHNILEDINDGRISNKEDLSNAGNYLVSNVEFSAKELDDLEADLNKIKIQLQLGE